MRAEQNYGKIIIENYTVEATHGVNPEEKTEAQPFSVSAVLYENILSAAKSDDVDQTTSYSAVCKRIKAFFCDNCFNLLEKLADDTARLILSEFDKIVRAEVTVKKPKAPMKGKFDYVAVSCCREWTRVFLSLGSNMGDRNAYLDKAVEMLKEDKNIRFIKESNRLQNEAYGGVASGEFINSAVEIYTTYKPLELLDAVHNIENECGRVRRERWGDRTLDVDVLFFGNEVYDEGDLIVPHPDMQNRSFVLLPMSELAPNLIHPVLNKRICELLKNIE